MSTNSIEIAKTDDVWGDDDLDDLNINELGEILDNPLPKEAFETLRTNEQNQGFNNNAGSTWMYPSNMPLRSYQYSITHAALFKNTLVVLPTGLGKTFIAAVVMYNIYRWYPTGKVIFMAPTRPLVAQQINACNEIMPFATEDTIELTGKLQRNKRMTCWRDKRVFFATPQALQADMFNQSDTSVSDFPFQQVKLIVVDEAHRAKGRYAYVEVVQALNQRNKYFRVLALSATPGRTLEDVVEVVRNLFISHLEVRWDTSIDVVQYVHQRNIKKIVVQYSDSIKRVREQLIKIIDPYMRQLIDADVVSSSHQHITRNYLIMAQKRFLERSMQQTHPQKSAVTSNFSICISLYHALELLERHGLRVFLNSFEEDEDGRQKFVLSLNPSLRNLVEELRNELGPNPFDISAHAMTNGRIADIPKDLDFGHPKFEEARKCILAHFEKHADSRAIVFCEYRESVMMIYRLLLQHMPVLQPKCFVGQGGTTGALRALSQKQQIQIMNDFRAGKANILIATSIGEEGIDVGEVDLIVCFDINTSNPVRFVQRIGRTGRKRRGQVIMLVTEGKEQKILDEVLANKDQTNKKLLRSTLVQAALYKQSPRMVPTEFNPECVHIHVRPRSPIEQKKISKTTSVAPAKKKKPLKSKATLANTQDLRKFLMKEDNKIDHENDLDDENDFEPAETQVEKPTEITQSSMARVEKLFSHLRPCASSNTQLLGEMESDEVSAVEKTTQVKLDTQQLKKLNKFFKSSAEVLLPTQHDQLLTHLQSESCSKAAKLLLLRKSFKKVREICEQMKILQALNVEEDVNDMSTHELEIRQTFDSILNLFENRAALQRFLEDAELDVMAAEQRKVKQAALLNDWDMTWSSYKHAKQKIFEGLDLQGPSWDSFDYRQEALKQTKAYQAFMAKQSDANQKRQPVIELNSMVFNAVHHDESTTFNDLEDMTLNSLANDAGESKYCSQWLADDSFQTNQVNAKSTPKNSAIFKAFERQKSNLINSKKQLETVKEPAFESDDDDDVIFLPLGDEVSNTKQVNVGQTDQAIAKSLLQCQQSTPIPQKAKLASNLEKSLEHILDFDIEQAFSENFSQEIELQNENKVEILSGSSLKENAKPKADIKVVEKPNGTLSTKQKPQSASSLFEMLETKPVNSILTPKRSLAITTPPPMKRNEITKNASLISSKRAQSFDSTPPQLSLAKQQQSKVQALTNSCSPQSFHESPKTRPQTAKETYEKSPSIFSSYTKAVQRLESRRKMRADSLLQNAPDSATSSKSAITNNADIDSPLVGKRKRNGQKLRRKIVESDTDDERTFQNSPVRLSSHSSNSDDDFEQVEASPKLKRRCLGTQNSKAPRRARLCQFFDDEAEKSAGSGHSEDEEHEATLGNFVCDSVIIDDDDTDEEGATSATQMQAVYLQSVNSPKHRQRGGFKIPPPRAYDINVYSQAVPAEPSHYGLDSFVVYDDEGEEHVSVGKDTTLCPLEQAERILKERRRMEKRRRCKDQEIENPSKKRARKCYQLNDSDDSSDDCGG